MNVHEDCPDFRGASDGAPATDSFAAKMGLSPSHYGRARSMSPTRRVAATLLAGAVFATGCGTEARPKPPPAAAVPAIDAPGLARLLERQHGKVVLVDFWATWCGPCLELFPHTVELHRRHWQDGLAVITVSLDDPDNELAVRRFLERNEAYMENFLGRYGVGPDAFAAFGIADGALPHLKLYGRDGRLLKSFAGGGRPIDPKEVQRAVEAALK